MLIANTNLILIHTHTEKTFDIGTIIVVQNNSANMDEVQKC